MKLSILLLLLIVSLTVQAQSKRQLAMIEDAVRFESDLKQFSDMAIAVTGSPNVIQTDQYAKARMERACRDTKFALEQFTILLRTSQTPEQLGKTDEELQRLVVVFNSLTYQADLVNAIRENQVLQAYLRGMDLDLRRITAAFKSGGQKRQRRMQAGAAENNLRSDEVGRFNKQTKRTGPASWESLKWPRYTAKARLVKQDGSEYVVPSGVVVLVEKPADKFTSQDQCENYVPGPPKNLPCVVDIRRAHLLERWHFRRAQQ